MVWRELDRQVSLLDVSGPGGTTRAAAPQTDRPFPAAGGYLCRPGEASLRVGARNGGSPPGGPCPLTALPPPRSKLYTADLESGLHYLLRVELAAHRSLAGAELRTLKDFVTVVAKVRAASAPGGGSACGHGTRDALPPDLRDVCA